MKFNYIVMNCTKNDGSTLEFPIMFPSKMNLFEIQDALQRSEEIFEIYESNRMVSSGIVEINPDGVSCTGHTQALLDMFKDKPNLVTLLKSRGDIDRKLIESFN